MIIVKITGGTGNQMFQYALARAISLRNNIEFKLDISGFDSYKLHPYRLNKFNIVENIASESEIRKYTRWRFTVRDSFKKYYCFLDDLLHLGRPYYQRKYVREQDYTFDPNILKIVDDAYLDGYWGSEKYFRDCESVIRKDFSIRVEPDSENLRIAEMIRDSESVSIHFRRGDYVTDPVTNKIHGTCPPDYYHRAVEDVCRYTSNPKFFIFSNDPEWVRENFSIPYPVEIITHNGSERPECDLSLMKLCKHHITANSTFSWWGAWLSDNRNKRVYTPRKWYNVDYINHEDTVPEGWIKL